MKTIVFLKDYKQLYKKGDSVEVNVLQYGIVGGFDSNLSHGVPVMDGCLNWSVLCEIQDGSGRVIPFEIGYDVEVYDA